MTQTVFLDTNIILDYVESRNDEVRAVVAKLLALHEEERLLLTTSVLNVAEMIDKEFDFCFYKACIDEQMPYDEIIRRIRGDKRLYREVAQGGKIDVQNKVRDFLTSNQIEILFPDAGDPEEWEELYGLLYDHQLSSQDALVVFTALSNGATYFLSNDMDLVTTIGADESLAMYTCSLRDSNQRETFQDTVLEAI